MPQWCSVEGSYFPNRDFGVVGGVLMHTTAVPPHRAERGPTRPPIPPARAHQLAVFARMGNSPRERDA